MANRYEVVDETTGKVILPACGNLALDAWFDQRGSSDYAFEREQRHARQDDDYNSVHVTFVKERTFGTITPTGMLDESEDGEADFMPACITGCEPGAEDDCLEVSLEHPGALSNLPHDA